MKTLTDLRLVQNEEDGLTPSKTDRLAGERTYPAECLEAWWRIADSPSGKLLPDQIRGKRSDTLRMANRFDLYCWQIVGFTLHACGVRGCNALKLARLVAHVQAGGKVSTFAVYDVIQIDPEDPKGWRSRPRPVSEVDRMGVDDAWIARAAYAKFKKVLQVMIDEAEPYRATPTARMA